MSWQGVGRPLLSSDAIEFGDKFLEISEENLGAGRKGGSKQIESRDRGTGMRGGIGFAVPRKVARKQVVEPLGREMTENISSPIPAGANVGPKSQDDFRRMMGFWET